jgi:hypothetical protein
VRANWIEVARFPAVSGSRSRDAIDWFAVEMMNTIHEPNWTDEEGGVFEVLSRTFRIRLGGLESEFWVVEELKIGSARHG